MLLIGRRGKPLCVYGEQEVLRVCVVSLVAAQQAHPTLPQLSDPL